MNLTNQRRMAAELLDCGVNRVWIDPTRIEDVADAITRNDIRVMINAGAIKAAQKKGISSGRRKYLAGQKKKGRQRGPGSRKGAKGARTPRKREWIRKIRPIRARLKELREQGVLDSRTYRQYYRQAKGGMFKSKAHLDTQLKLHGILTEEAAPKEAKRPVPIKRVSARPPEKVTRSEGSEDASGSVATKKVSHPQPASKTIPSDSTKEGSPPSNNATGPSKDRTEVD